MTTRIENYLIAAAVLAVFGVLSVAPGPASPQTAPAVPPVAEGAPGIPPCAQGHEPERPFTGDRITHDRHVAGESTMHVSNGTSSDAVVKLVSVATRKTHRYFYIRAGETYTVSKIEAGTYWLRFATGKKWFDGCRKFLEDEAVSEFEKPLVFEVLEEVQDGRRGRLITSHNLTLNEVSQRNTKIRKIDPKAFSEGDEAIPAGPGQNI